MKRASDEDDKVVVTLRLPNDTRTPSEARKAVTDPLRSFVSPDELDKIRLIVSELVTNSVKHSGAGPEGWVEVRVSTTPTGFRLEVEDPGPGFEPNLPLKPSRRLSGWGLYLVDQLATRWGVVYNRVTRVWADIDRGS